MKMDEVKRYLIDFGYTAKTFYRKNEKVNILPFDSIFISKDKNEIYIIEEKTSLYEPYELDVMDGKILTFIQFLSNQDPIKYNINLLLLCPFNSKKDDKEIFTMLGIERSKYTCRKIFLDTSSVDFKQELSILPSFSLEVEFDLEDSQINNLSSRVKNIVNEGLYDELLKEDLSVEKILQLLEMKGED